MSYGLWAHSATHGSQLVAGSSWPSSAILTAVIVKHSLGFRLDDLRALVLAGWTSERTFGYTAQSALDMMSHARPGSPGEPRAIRPSCRSWVLGPGAKGSERICTG